MARKKSGPPAHSDLLPLLGERLRPPFGSRIDRSRPDLAVQLDLLERTLGAARLLGRLLHGLLLPGRDARALHHRVRVGLRLLARTIEVRELADVVDFDVGRGAARLALIGQVFMHIAGIGRAVEDHQVLAERSRA